MKHLKEHNESYFFRLMFALKISFYMIISSCFVLLHGFVPFIKAPKLFNIQSAARKLRKWDAYSQIRKLK